MDAYLVTDNAVVRASYVRLSEPSAVGGWSAVDIARSLARDMPPELITGGGGSIGTGFAHDVGEAIESIIATVQPADLRVLDSGALTVEAVGLFSSVDGALIENVSIRVEMLDGYLAPSFLGHGEDEPAGRIRRQSSRIGTSLVIVTIESDDVASQEALETATLDSIAEIINA